VTTGKQTTGQMAEETAYRYLEEQGLSLIERNYLCPRGEIDLIMKDRTTTGFC